MDIDNINYPAPKQEYKVLVRCFTFNQSKYIEDALNGFAMQKTNFPFTCLVVDDASTDGEQEVIKPWMERECDMSRAEIIDIPTSVVIIVPHKTNISCTFAFYLLKNNLYKAKEEKMRHVTPWREKCEYEALCEGDDYWIDPLKLQKQVDFLDSNVEYSCCHTGFYCVDFKGNKIYREDYERKNLIACNGERFWFTMLVENYILTCTFMLRTKFSISIPVEYHDYGIFLHAARHGFVGFLSDRTTCYRQTPGSIMNDNFKYTQLMRAYKMITIKEVLNIINCTSGTIKEILDYPNKNSAISRLLIFCINTDQTELKKEIFKIYLRYPLLFFRGVFYRLLKKQPSDFYIG